MLVLSCLCEASYSGRAPRNRRPAARARSKISEVYYGNVLRPEHERLYRAAGTLPYRINADGTLDVLLGAKKGSEDYDRSTWNILGGKRKIFDSNPLSTAAREAEEETLRSLRAVEVESALRRERNSVLWLPDASYILHLARIENNRDLSHATTGDLLLPHRGRAPTPRRALPSDPSRTPAEAAASELLARRGGAVLLAEFCQSLYADLPAAKKEITSAGGALRWLHRAGFPVRGLLDHGAHTTGEEAVMLPSAARDGCLLPRRSEAVDSLMWLPWALLSDARKVLESGGARGGGSTRVRSRDLASFRKTCRLHGGTRLTWSGAPNGRYVRIHPFLAATIIAPETGSMLRRLMSLRPGLHSRAHSGLAHQRLQHQRLQHQRLQQQTSLQQTSLQHADLQQAGIRQAGIRHAGQHMGRRVEKPRHHTQQRQGPQQAQRQGDNARHGEKPRQQLMSTEPTRPSSRHPSRHPSRGRGWHAGRGAARGAGRGTADSAGRGALALAANRDARSAAADGRQHSDGRSDGGRGQGNVLRPRGSVLRPRPARGGRGGGGGGRGRGRGRGDERWERRGEKRADNSRWESTW